MRRERRAANLRRIAQVTPNVEVLIDELVLHGFSVSERHVVGDALSLEIGRLLAESSIHPSLRQDVDLPALDAGRITISPNAKPASIGTQVARAVHASLHTGTKESQ